LVVVVGTATLVVHAINADTSGERGMSLADGLLYMFSGVLFPAMVAIASLLVVTLFCVAAWLAVSGSRRLAWLAFVFILVCLLIVCSLELNPPRAREKPVIYLYPEREQEVSVRLECPGILTCSYPQHGAEGWRVLARPDGSLTDVATGREHYCLYWEGVDNLSPDFEAGFVVTGPETAGFLEDALGKLGLNERESNEFIIYWLPRMINNRFNVIRFEADEYESRVPLIVDPQPDTVIRIFMVFRGCEEPRDLPAQRLRAKERRGFTLVEWGGAELSR
jgi:hypothetical protein